MGTYIRRTQIWEKLRVRRKDTIANLANEFGVSKQTIRRDIDVLCREHYIYTMPGRYNGGVFVGENSANYKYFSEVEYIVACKILQSLKEHTICELTNDELKIYEKLVYEHTKPIIGKEDLSHRYRTENKKQE